MLVDVLNSQYGTKLKANHRLLNTTDLGYFGAMKAAVNSGACDVVTSNVSVCILYNQLMENNNRLLGLQSELSRYI